MCAQAAPTAASPGRLPALCALAVIAGMLAACTAPGPEPAPPKSSVLLRPNPSPHPRSARADRWNGEVVRVDIARSAFRPARIRVTGGTRIVWTNRDKAIHNVAFQADLQMVGEPLRRGDRFALVIGEPGRYGFVCTFHSSVMRGWIDVVAR